MPEISPPKKKKRQWVGGTNDREELLLDAAEAELADAPPGTEVTPLNIGTAPVPSPLHPEVKQEPLSSYAARHERESAIEYNRAGRSQGRKAIDFDPSTLRIDPAPDGTIQYADRPATPTDPARNVQTVSQEVSGTPPEALDLPPGAEPIGGDLPPGAEPVREASEDEVRAYDRELLKRDIKAIHEATLRGGTENEQVLEIANYLGADPKLVKKHLPEFKVKMEVAKKDYDKFVDENEEIVKGLIQRPELAGVWLADESLWDAWERLKFVGRGIASAAREVAESGNSGSRIGGFRGGAQEAAERQQRDPEPAIPEKSGKKVPTMRDPSASGTIIDKGMAVIAQTMKQTELSELNFKRSIAKARGKDTFDLDSKILKLRQDLSIQRDYDANWFEQFWLGGVETGTQLVGAWVGGGKGMAAGAAAGAVIRGGAAAVMRRPGAIPKEMVKGAKQGAKIGGAAGAAEYSFEQEYGSMYDNLSQDPNLSEDMRLGASAFYGILAAAVEVASLGPVTKMFGPLGDMAAKREAKAFMRALLTNPTMRSIFADAGRRFANGVASETGEEAVQAALEVFTDWAAKYESGEKKPFPTEEVFRQAVNSAEKAALGMSAVGIIGAHSTMIQHTLKKKTAERAGERVAIIAGLAESDSPTVKAAPGFIAEMIEEETAKSGEKVSNLYIDPNAIIDIFEQQDVDPREAANEIFGPGGDKKLEEAIATGTNIEVSVKDYLEKVGPKGIASKLQDDTTTRRGLKTKNQQTLEEEAKTAAEAKKMADEEEKKQKEKKADPLEAIFETLSKQLEESGKYTGKDIPAMVDIWRKRIATAAAREGKDAFEIAKRWVPDIAITAGITPDQFLRQLAAAQELQQPDKRPFRASGFRNKTTKQVVETGAFHDIVSLIDKLGLEGEAMDKFIDLVETPEFEWEAGFVEEDGNFLNRGEAAKKVGQSGTLRSDDVMYQEEEEQEPKFELPPQIKVNPAWSSIYWTFVSDLNLKKGDPKEVFASAVQEYITKNPQLADQALKIPFELVQQYQAALEEQDKFWKKKQQKIEEKSQNHKKATITEAFKRWFKNSKVVNEAGEPMVVFHATGAITDYTVFRVFNDMGHHFGTYQAANWRADMLADMAAPVFNSPTRGTITKEKVRVYPVFLSIQNPLELPDMGTWEPDDIADVLSGFGMYADINKAERMSLSMAGSDYIEKFTANPILTPEEAVRIKIRTGKQAKSILLQEILQRKGYDGIKYYNMAEDEGSVSWVAFKPTQIKSVFNEGGFRDWNANILMQDDVIEFREAVKRRAPIQLSFKVFRTMSDEEKETFAKAFETQHPDMGIVWLKSDEGGLFNIVDLKPNAKRLEPQEALAMTGSSEWRAPGHWYGTIWQLLQKADKPSIMEPSEAPPITDFVPQNQKMEEYVNQEMEALQVTDDQIIPDEPMEITDEDIVDDKPKTVWPTKLEEQAFQMAAWAISDGGGDGGLAMEKHPEQVRMLAKAMQLDGITELTPEELEGMAFGMSSDEETQALHAKYPFTDSMLGAIFDGTDETRTDTMKWILREKFKRENLQVIEGEKKDETRQPSANDQIFFQDDVGSSLPPVPLYSAVWKAIKEVKRNKGNAQAWINELKRAPNVKQEEIDYLGLEKWLKEQKGEIKRDDIENYIWQHRVEITEGEFNDPYSGYTLGGSSSGARVMILRWPSGFQSGHFTKDALSSYEATGQAKGAEASLPEANKDYLAHVRFSIYTNVRGEKILHIDEIQSDLHGPARREGYRTPEATAIQQRLERAEDAVNALQKEVFTDEIIEEKRNELVNEAESKGFRFVRRSRRDVRIEVMREDGDWFDITPGEYYERWDYRHQNFYEIWTQATEAVLDGSITDIREYKDWANLAEKMTPEMLAYAQSGRLTAAIEIFKKKNSEFNFGDLTGISFSLFVNPQQAQQYDKLRKELEEAREARYQIKMSDYPDAPFKGSGYEELAVKRMMVYAAEIGADRVTWATGQMQAGTRYHTMRTIAGIQWQMIDSEDYYGKKVKLLQLTENEWDDYNQEFRDQMYEMDISPRGGSASQTEWDLRELAEYRKLPKELIEKIRATLGTPDAPDPRWSELQETENQYGRRLPKFTGEELFDPAEPLQIGGKGHVEEYDQRLPKFFEKWTKKFNGKTESFKLTKEWQTLDVNSDYGREPKVWSIPLSQELKYMLLTGGLPLFQDQAEGDAPQEMNLPRGFVVRMKEGLDRLFKLVLTEKADLSTFLHESGHIFFSMMDEMASAPDASPQLKTDLEAAVKWMGIGSIQELRDRAAKAAAIRRKAAEEGRALTAEEKKEFNALVAPHEKWAKGFEKYLADGKAPSASLAGAFQRFKLWMKEAYKRILRGAYFEGVEIDENIRGVFDRLLATDLEIQRMRAHMGLQPMWRSPEEAGMTPEQWESYLKSQALGMSQGAIQAERRAMKDALHVSQQWWKEQEKILYEEALKEYDLQPAFRAYWFIRAGELIKDDGTREKTTLERLDLKAVQEMIGEEAAKRFTGRLQKKGIHPDEVAGMFKFESGKAMLEAVIGLPPREETAKKMAQERMNERHADELTDQQKLKDAIGREFHNSFTLDALLAEWQALKSKTVQGPGGLPLEAIKKAAKILAERAKIGNLRPSQILAAERDACDKAFLAAAKDEYDAAYIYKQQQILNYLLYKEIMDARDERDAFQGTLKKHRGVKRREALGKAAKELVDVSDAVLEAIGAKPKETDVEALGQRRGLDGLLNLIDQELMVAAFDVESIRTLLAVPKPWKELTVGEMRNILNLLKQLNKMRLKFTKITNKKKAEDVETFMAKLAADAEGMPERTDQVPASETAMPRSWWTKQNASGINAALQDPERMFRRLGKTAYDFFWKGYIYSRNVEHRLARKLLARVDQIWTNLPEELQKKRFDLVDASSLPFPDNVNQSGPRDRQWMWMVALNIGNPGNLMRLLGGYDWKEDQVRAWLNANMTKEEWDFVQGVWDLFDEDLYPELASVYEAIHGVRPTKIAAQKFLTPHGEYRGGYFPAKYRPESSRRGQMQEAASVENMDRVFPGASVLKGFTKPRAAKYADVIDLNWHVVPSHIADVIHFIAYDGFVRDANRIMNNSPKDAKISFRTIAQNRLGEEYRIQLEKWLRVVATGRADSAPRHMRGWLNAIAWGRTRFVMSTIGYSIGVAAGDLPTVLTAVTSGKVKTRYLIPAMIDALVNPLSIRGKAKQISSELEIRSDRSRQKLLRRIGEVGRAGKIPTWEKPLEAVRDGAWWMMEMTDKIVSTLVWEGAYRQALAENGAITDGEAGEMADEVVRGLLPSHELAEQPSFLRDKRSVGALVAFYSYFNKLYNVMRDVWHPVYKEWAEAEGISDKIGAVAAPATWAMGYTLATFFVTNVLSELLSGRGPEDDEEVPEWLLRKMLAAPFMMIPIIGSAGEAITYRVVSGKVRKVSIRGAPVTAAFQRIYDDFERAGRSKKDWDKFWAVADAGLTFFKLPAAQVSKTGSGIQQIVTGQKRVKNPFDAAGDVIYGPERKGKR